MVSNSLLTEGFSGEERKATFSNWKDRKYLDKQGYNDPGWEEAKRTASKLPVLSWTLSGSNLITS